VVLYGCEIWSLTLREEHKVRVFENRVLRRIFRPKRDDVSSSWTELKFGVPQGSILGPLFFLLYINDISKVSVNGAKILLYADDTSITVTNPEYNNYNLIMTRIFHEANTWFRAYLLKLNINKTHILQFVTINHGDYGMHNCINHNLPANSECITFLGDDKLSWKSHIDYLVTRLRSLCFVMRTIKPIMSLKSFRMIYYAYMHSISHDM
jgi:hypothetical protein